MVLAHCRRIKVWESPRWFHHERGSGFESVNARFIQQEPYQLSRDVISGGYSDGIWQAAQSSMHEALIPGQLIQLTWSGKNRMRETSACGVSSQCALPASIRRRHASEYGTLRRERHEILPRF
ncbi:MAG: hypothetical protein KQI78_03620 [Deltaproteobacteria bacterium]|nr:hypothetical protein [Deltaproteobacteria bacterium]